MIKFLEESELIDFIQLLLELLEDLEFGELNKIINNFTQLILNLNNLNISKFKYIRKKIECIGDIETVIQETLYLNGGNLTNKIAEIEKK